MRNLTRLTLPTVLLLTATPVFADPPEALGPQAKAILQAHCARCHSGGKAKGRFGFVLDRDQLVVRDLVVPGKVRQSELYARIEKREMPPGWGGGLPEDEIKAIKSWIEAGAPAFEPSLPRDKILTQREVTETILADFARLEPRRQRFTRYLTLAHLAHAGRTDKDLDATREAATKLLNSLSWHPRLGILEPVDPGRTILRIDLRSIKWTVALWEKLAGAYPYRLQTAAETRALVAATGTEQPAIRADWFVATASRPPLYHDLLQLPETDRALERLLQVDVPGDVENDNIMRAGFNDSGVSKNNRLLERHDAAYGTLWRSYDFANNRDRQNLFEHPLGPNAGAVSFQPAGGEMIFHLPNGLQGYMLVNGTGKRIDKAPVEIVADPQRPDKRVETGISCMSCHARGLLPKTDQLRGHVEKNAAAFGDKIVSTIRATHPRKAKFQVQVEEDNVRYLKALEKIGVRDPDQEPVNQVTQRFEATIDGRTAAAELGLTTDEFAAFLKKHEELTRVFGTLLVKGGTVQREVFQESFAELASRVLATREPLSKIAADTKFQGHTATVQCVAFAADGKTAATGSDDKTVRVWSIPDGKELAVLKNGGEVYAVAFSPDGKTLLSAGRDRIVRMWDLESKKEVRVFEGHTDSVRALAFAPNGKRVVSGSDDRSVRIWEFATGKEKSALVGHTGPVTSVAWAGNKGFNSTAILSGSRDGTMRRWPTGGKQLLVFEGHAGAVLDVAISPDGLSALSAGNDKTVRLWSLKDGKELHTFKGHDSAVIRAQYVGDGGEFLSSNAQFKYGDHQAWRRWNPLEGKEVGTPVTASHGIFGCAAFSPDGRYVLVGGPMGVVRLSQLGE